MTAISVSLACVVMFSQPIAQFVRGALVVSAVVVSVVVSAAAAVVSAVSLSLPAGPAHLRAASPQIQLRSRTLRALIGLSLIHI